ncbi:hypothetical protein QR98_0084800 [Sarcoptes scabiei]|uniref:Uncharacterized protein n=1 Tax=Sarcoptes scabiei TaxID=52283 RepID=A0A132AG26_SARSC|nr:hypothetical protein QR98_0084800 [Sarcoptes scabiei]
MDQHNRYFGSNRQSLRPSSGSTMASSMLASRYGFQFGSNSSSSSCKRPGSNNTSPNRSRSNSASRFKAAAAVAVAAATGSKQFGSNHRSSVSMPFNVLTGNSSSTSNQIANSSGASGSSSDGNTAGISSTVVSFMRKKP